MQFLDVLLFVLIALCGITDLQTGKIYNKATYPAILLGFVWNIWIPGGPGLKSSLLGFAVAAVLMGTLTLLGGMGGGDAKLLAAIGAMKGYPFILDSLFYSFLVGGALALIIAVWQRRLPGILGRVGRMLFAAVIYRINFPAALDEGASYKIPFGVAICLGTLWAQLLELLRN
jgi:prepilin peptidase CpaA